MMTLRNVSLTTMIILIILAGANIWAASTENWILFIVLANVAMLIAVSSVLITARHLTHHILSAEHKSRTTTQRLAARIKDSIQRDGKTRSELRQLAKRTNNTLDIVQQDTEQSITALHNKLNTLEQDTRRVPQTVARNVSSTVRDSTRQIEGMFQLYNQFVETKAPMPSTGGFAIDAQALGHLMTIVSEQQPKKILELGSGTSTIWLGYLCERNGGKIVSLDHLEQYRSLTQAAIERHDLSEVIDLRLAPLQEITTNDKTFNWYSANAYEDLSEIDLLIADGPPAATGPQARFPSLPMLLQKLSPNATVVLDDAHRKDEQDIVEAWLEAYPEFEVIDKGTSRLAVLRRNQNVGA